MRPALLAASMSDLYSRPLAQIDASGNITYIHTDHLGTPLRFPGQYADAAAGLNHNIARDDDPALGRYIQADPIGFAGGPNLYGYAGQNPELYVDPHGKNPLVAALFARAMIAGLSATIIQGKRGKIDSSGISKAGGSHVAENPQPNRYDV